MNNLGFFWDKIGRKAFSSIYKWCPVGQSYRRVEPTKQSKFFHKFGLNPNIIEMVRAETLA